jgi:hypothetical protein
MQNHCIMGLTAALYCRRAVRFALFSITVGT